MQDTLSAKANTFYATQIGSPFFSFHPGKYTNVVSPATFGVFWKIKKRTESVENVESVGLPGGCDLWSVLSPVCTRGRHSLLPIIRCWAEADMFLATDE